MAYRARCARGPDEAVGYRVSITPPRSCLADRFVIGLADDGPRDTSRVFPIGTLEECSRALRAHDGRARDDRWRHALLDEELASIDRYLARGGAALLILDPMRDAGLGILEGTVTLNGGGSPAGTQLELVGTNYAVESCDGNGAFGFDDLFPGTYLLRATRAGYDPAELRYISPAELPLVPDGAGIGLD